MCCRYTWKKNSYKVIIRSVARKVLKLSLKITQNIKQSQMYLGFLLTKSEILHLLEMSDASYTVWKISSAYMHMHASLSYTCTHPLLNIDSKNLSS